MKIRDMVYKEIGDLSSTEYVSIYQYIHTIKSNRPENKNKPREHWYLNVSKALDGISGELAQDIIEGREDRV